MAEPTNYEEAELALDSAAKNAWQANVEQRDREGAQVAATIAVGRAILALVDELREQRQN